MNIPPEGFFALVALGRTSLHMLDAANPSIGEAAILRVKAGMVCPPERHRIALHRTFRRRHCEPPLGGAAIHGGEPPAGAMDCRASLAMTATPLRGPR